MYPKTHKHTRTGVSHINNTILIDGNTALVCMLTHAYSHIEPVKNRRDNTFFCIKINHYHLWACWLVQMFTAKAYCTRTRTHARTQTHTRIHARTHMHVHTQCPCIVIIPSRLFPKQQLHLAAEPTLVSTSRDLRVHCCRPGRQEINYLENYIIIRIMVMNTMRSLS